MEFEKIPKTVPGINFERHEDPDLGAFWCFGAGRVLRESDPNERKLIARFWIEELNQSRWKLYADYREKCGRCYGYEDPNWPQEHPDVKNRELVAAIEEWRKWETKS